MKHQTLVVQTVHGIQQLFVVPSHFDGDDDHNVGTATKAGGNSGSNREDTGQPDMQGNTFDISSNDSGASFQKKG